MAPKLFDHPTTWAGPCVGSAPLNFALVLQIWSWRLREPCIRWGCRCPNGNGTFRGASSPLQSIGFQGLCNRVSCAKMIYTSYDVLLHKEVPFRGCDVTAAHLEGKITKKIFIWGMKRHFEVRLVKYQHLCIIKTTASFPTVISDMSSWDSFTPKTHPLESNSVSLAIRKLKL